MITGWFESVIRVFRFPICTENWKPLEAAEVAGIQTMTFVAPSGLRPVPCTQAPHREMFGKNTEFLSSAFSTLRVCKHCLFLCVFLLQRCKHSSERLRFRVWNFLICQGLLLLCSQRIADCCRSNGQDARWSKGKKRNGSQFFSQITLDLHFDPCNPSMFATFAAHL